MSLPSLSRALATETLGIMRTGLMLACLVRLLRPQLPLRRWADMSAIEAGCIRRTAGDRRRRIKATANQRRETEELSHSTARLSQRDLECMRRPKYVIRSMERVRASTRWLGSTMKLERMVL